MPLPKNRRFGRQVLNGFGIDQGNAIFDGAVGNLSAVGIPCRIIFADIRRIGRNTQGVRLINLTPEQRLVGVVRIAEDNTRPVVEASSATMVLDADGEEAVIEEPELDDGLADTPDEESSH